MTYKELLETYEWRSRRWQILARDRYKCQNCKNCYHLEDFNYSPFSVTPKGNCLIVKPIVDVGKELIELKGFIPYEWVDALIYGDRDLQRFVLYKVTDEKKSLCDIVGIFQVRGIEKDSQTKHPMIFHSDEDLSKIIWWYLKGLHVHHKYYKIDSLPWEYPDEALVTLCWYCHEELHMNQDVPVYNEDMVRVDYFTPCLRCSGAGWFPEFIHIESGICFRCEGAKYEELIE